MNPISAKSHPPPPPTRNEKRRKLMGKCADTNCKETLGTATETMQQANEHPIKCKPAAKKPLSRLVNHHHRRYPSKMNSTAQINYRQQSGVESSVNLRKRFACCKLDAAKSICRHRSCKALTTAASTSSTRKSTKALANLRNVTTNFVLGTGIRARPAEGGEEKGDGKHHFEKLMLSLQSPLPNEHTFALKILTVICSVVGDNALNIFEATPALLNMLLAHVGFYSDCALRLLMEQTCDHRDFKAFWKAVGNESEHLFQLRRQLLCECYPQDVLNYGGKCCDGCVAFQDLVSLNKPPNMALPVATEKVGAQVQQIGNILRNFSFEAGNASKMALNGTMMRFLLVAGTSEYGSLPQISFDIISSITKYMKLMPLASNDKSSIYQLQAIMMDLVISTFINSGDRFKIIRCLEALQGLALSSGDREAKLRIFRDMRLFEKLFQFLTLKEDTILVINCLECLLAATVEGMGEIICDKIVESVHGCVGTLVSYLTVDVLENFVEKEDGIRNENFRTELIEIQRSLGSSKPAKKISFSEKVPTEKKINGCVGVGNQPCVKIQHTPQQTSVVKSSSESKGKYHITPSSSSRRKLGPFDEAMTIIENLKKIPDGKPIILVLSPQALSILERKPDLQIKRLLFPPMKNPHSPTSINSGKVCVEVMHRNNVLVKKPKNGIIWSPLSSMLSWPSPSMLSSMPFSLSPSLNNILETAIPFLCEWDSCGSRHISKIQLRWHVYLWHLPNNKVDKSVCKWKSRTSSTQGCFNPRSKDCLLEHLMEHHYNDKALEQALYQRLHKKIISPRENSTVFTEHGNIKDWANGGTGMIGFGCGSQLQQQTEEKGEHAVNKSVRLTAALILRNFVENSGLAKRSLRKYELHLAEVAMSGYDCGGIISHVLHNLNEE